MESFHVNEEQQMHTSSFTAPRKSCKSGRWFIGAFIMVAFVIGIVVGYVGSVDMLSAMGNKEGCSDEDGASSPSIESEFESGFDAVEEWFPESANILREHRSDIIHHLVAVTDPRPDSDLWQLHPWQEDELESGLWTPEEKRSRRLQRESNTTNATLPSTPTSSSIKASTSVPVTYVAASSSIKRSTSVPVRYAAASSSIKRSASVPVTTSTTTSSSTSSSTSTSTTTTPRDICTEAIADFLHQSLNFVTGFVRFTIPFKYAFRMHLVTRIYKLPSAKFNELARDSLAWVQQHGTEEKVRALWAFMKKSWNSWVKIMFQWLLVKMENIKPWEVVKDVVRLASQFAVWFRSKSPSALMGAVGLQLDAGHDVFEAGRYALQQCNVTVPNPFAREPVVASYDTDFRSRY